VYGQKVPGLRLLLRAAPLVGALAVAVWLRRRRPPRRALSAPAAAPRLEPPRARTGRFDREPIDIVTVVDDLLLPGH
jgi:hypothetical protein